MRTFLVVFALAILNNTYASSVELIGRHTGGDYVTATYSFKHKTRDNVDLTKNNWEILFEARDDFKDYFETEMVVDDMSFIVDLGKIQCSDLETNDNKYKNPYLWLKNVLGYNHAFSKSSRAIVNEGHCYFVASTDSDNRVFGLFYVEKHIEDKSVVLGQVETLKVD